MRWDDPTTPWDRLTIWQGKVSWAIHAEADWPDGRRSTEALFNLTLPGVIDAIGQRGPYVGQVVWRSRAGICLDCQMAASGRFRRCAACRSRLAERERARRNGPPRWKPGERGTRSYSTARERGWI